ncbi:hypothetical protein PIROE2DRAFT_69735 [Piromyces sp. E2]|nr:hypothetical protein PIROE2DRAFT_69735 [Piromyces sp. E2]|eukprot:OUM60392.1 hypothetical protein PIROE2DRAFT_69735 [Piromyces sp. E2]
MAPIIIDTGIFDRPILIQNDNVNQSRIVKEIVIEEQKPVIIDTGIFDRPILIQPKQFELSENSKQVSQRSYVVQEGDSEVLVEEVVYEEYIDEDDGADGERVIVEEIVEEYVDENEEEKPIIIDTGIFDRPILVQSGVEQQQPREVVVAQGEPAECRGDTGCWWLFYKPQTTEVVEEQPREIVVVEEEEKPIIIDTGIFDRPILVQSGVEQQPREVVVVEEEESQSSLTLVSSTDQFLFNLVLNNNQEKPILVQSGVEQQQPREVVIAQGEPAECRGDTGCWWLFYKPQTTEIVEEQPREVIVEEEEKPIIIDTEVVVVEEEKPIIIDTGIFDRPILVQSGVEQQPREVVVVEEEEKPIIIDTGIFDRPILVQSGVEQQQQPREVVVVAQDEPAECRGDTGCWWLFYKPQTTEIVEEQPREVIVEEEEKPIIIDTGIFDRPILVQSGVEQQPREVVVVEEEEKPIIIDTGIFDKPILVQSGVEQQQPREVVVVAQGEPAECRGDTGCWWLFAKPEVTTEVREIMIRDQLLKKKDDELDELKNIVDKKDSELKSQNNDYQNLIRSNEELNHQLTQLNILNKKLQQNVKSSGLVTPPNETERDIEAHNALLSCRLENAAINNEIKLKNAEIEKLTSRIVALNQQLARLTLSVDEEQRKDRETISILRSKVDGYLEKLVKLNGQVSSLTLLIDELKKNKEATTTESTASTSNGNNAVARKYIYLSPESRQIITNIVSRATQNKCNIL